VIYFADLHLHSRFSRATSRDCTLVELARWASTKGVLVLGSGDFTHPQWSAEIRDQLEDAGDGLFRLKGEHLPPFDILPGGFGPGNVRFLLTVEISSIYKKRGATRKIHNLVFMPDLEAIERFNSRLGRIGNIASDGRPILGLDSRDLLEIALEASSDAYVVPAHVWTPWFSLLGSRSGFDSVEECFEDLSSHIFALETGLSSDPEMNRRVASLDGYTLISNSDTHSPGNLGREANIFAGAPGYVAIREAIRAGGEGGDPAGRWIAANEVAYGTDQAAPDAWREMFQSHGRASTPQRFVGTLEFFPEEGKYHLDGHRKCSVRLDPKQTAELDGRCPVCGHPVTVGVMNRVMELGDRLEGVSTNQSAPFWRVVPLAEVIGQALGVGVHSKKVGALYREIVGKLGPELMILWAAPVEEIALHAPEIVVEGIARMRRGELHIQAGYDGEYGTVKLFTDAERHHFSGQQALVPVDRVKPRGRSRQSNPPVRKRKPSSADDKSEEPAGPDLNDEQRAAVSELQRPVIVKAGPGTGKTRTLTMRAAYLMERGVAPGRITAVTFTRKAAAEMQSRVEALVSPDAARECWVGTFHQLSLRIMDRFGREGVFIGRELVLGRDEALAVFREAFKASGRAASTSVAGLFDRVGLLKQDLIEPDDPDLDEDIATAYRAYEDLLDNRQALDLDDLVRHAVRLLKDYPDRTRYFRDDCAEHLLVDEFQDVNRGQYELVRLLAGPSAVGLFVIGDPDQAIYGFRGADRRFFMQFGSDYPEALEMRLLRNYRSRATILDAAQCVLNMDAGRTRFVPTKSGGTPVGVVRLPNSATEGIFITRTIDEMLGGASFLSVDSGIAAGNSATELGFSDFAILYRLNAVGDALEEAFQSAGIPYQRARKDDPQEEAEAIDRRVQAVSLMTIHAAKGLEFPVVFVAGCEDGVLPYEPPGDGEMDEDEERRLLYVAMTRAESVLYLTGSASRVLFGRTCRSPGSRFVGSIDKDLCRFESPLEGRRQEPPSGPVQCELF